MPLTFSPHTQHTLHARKVQLHCVCSAGTTNAVQAVSQSVYLFSNGRLAAEKELLLPSDAASDAQCARIVVVHHHAALPSSVAMVALYKSSTFS
jgi:hypothetical protein